MIAQLWRSGEVPYADGLYRPDDTGIEVHVDGPGAYHPQAGQPIPFRLGGPVDVAHIIDTEGTAEVDRNFDSPIPDGSGWLVGGGGGMGNIGHLARLDADRGLCWVAFMWASNPFVDARIKGSIAVFTNDWGNRLTLDLGDPAFS